MIVPVNIAGNSTANVVVVYAEFAQSYMAQPKIAFLSFLIRLSFLIGRRL